MNIYAVATLQQEILVTHVSIMTSRKEVSKMEKKISEQ